MPENLGRGYLFSQVQKLTLEKELKMRLTKRKTTANKVLSKAGQNGFDWAYVQGSTFVL